MPIYEYRCNACGRRSQIFFRSFSAAEGANCPHCHATDLNRLPSRVAQVRSESSREDFLSDPSNFANVDYEDPRSVAEWAKHMGETAGVDMGGDYDDMIEQLEHGEGFGGEMHTHDADGGFGDLGDFD